MVEEGEVILLENKNSWWISSSQPATDDVEWSFKKSNEMLNVKADVEQQRKKTGC